MQHGTRVVRVSQNVDTPTSKGFPSLVKGVQENRAAIISLCRCGKSPSGIRGASALASTIRLPLPHVGTSNGWYKVELIANLTCTFS